MTRLQARYVQYLTLIGCSLRATHMHYRNRYEHGARWTEAPHWTWGGNQMTGILLRKEAIEHLKSAGIEPHMNEMGNDIGYEQDSYKNWRNDQRTTRKII